MLSNLVFKDAVLSSNLFKLYVNFLELLFTLFVDGHLLVDKLFYNIFKVELRLGMIEGLLFHWESWRVLRFGVWVKWMV